MSSVKPPARHVILALLGMIALAVFGLYIAFKMGRKDAAIEETPGGTPAFQPPVRPPIDHIQRAQESHRTIAGTNDTSDTVPPATDRTRQRPSAAGPHGQPLVDPSTSSAEEGNPATSATQVYEILQESRGQSLSRAEQTARGMMTSDNPLMRACGAMILIEKGAFTGEDATAVSSDADPSVALNALGWLRDMGQESEAGELMGLMKERLADQDTLLDVLDTDTMLPSGQRLVLDLLSSRLPVETAAGLYDEIAANEDIAYSVRMKSVLLLRGTTDFDAYREEVKRLAADASATEWKESLQRLSEQLEGPVEIHTDPPSISGDDIDERLARPYPAMLEDLALHIEAVLVAPDHLVEKGTSGVLKEYLDDFRKQPATPEQQMSLKRLEALDRKVAEQEPR